MLRWLLIGVLFACYRLVVEEQVLWLLEEVRNVIHLTRQRRPRAAAPPRSRGEVFLGGVIAGLIVVLWPLYIPVAIGKLIGFHLGVYRKGHGLSD